jgi:uncharacterized protein (TIGR03086 family)
MEMDQLLERGLTGTHRVIAGVQQEQLDDPSPCEGWKVRDVMNHIVGGNHFFAAAASGEPLPSGDGGDLLGDDPAGAYEAGMKRALDAWRSPGVAERTVTLPIGDLPGTMAMGIHFVDHLVHAWDISKATGQDTALDPELAETAFRMFHGRIGDDRRGGEGAPFGPEVPCAEDAPAIERLVAYLGRTP